MLFLITEANEWKIKNFKSFHVRGSETMKCLGMNLTKGV